MADSCPQPRPITADQLCYRWCIGLVVLVCAVFHPVVHGEFLLWDDDVNIFRNTHLYVLDAEHLKWMFANTSYLWRYQPLCWFTWAVINHFFGMQPFYFHLAVLLFHAANSVLVFLFVRDLLLISTQTPRNNAPAVITTCAGLASLFWAIHPLRVETTAWAVELVFVQPLFFFLLSLIVYVRTANSDAAAARRGRWLSFALFIISLLSYPIAMFGCAAFVALDFFPLRRLKVAKPLHPDKTERAVWLEKIPFVLATLFFFWINVHARTRPSENFAPPATLAEFGIAPRVMQAFFIWAWYVWKPWVPWPMTPLHTVLFSFKSFTLPFILSALLVIGLTILLWKRRERWAWAFAAWLCYLLLLVPMLGLSERYHGPTDRYSLVVGIIWSAVLAGGFWKIWPRLETRRALLSGVAIIVCILAFLSYRQTFVWHTNIAFFQEILQKEGSRLGDLKDPIYRRLSKAYVNNHQYAPAIDMLQKMINDRPADVDLRKRLGNAQRLAGDLAGAKTNFVEALRIDPNDLWAVNGLGSVLGQEGQLDLAAARFNEVLQKNPDKGGELEVEALQNMATVLQMQGKTAEAQIYLDRIRAITGGH